jgi:uncharacterized protein YjlB
MYRPSQEPTKGKTNRIRLSKRLSIFRLHFNVLGPSIADSLRSVKAGDLMVVPAGTQHQFINTGPNPLILYTIYSPAEHDPQTVHQTKEQGDEEEENGRDEAPAWR